MTCWSCGQPATDDEQCGWCGVWLAPLDPQLVPQSLRPLLGSALRWGISDDGYRSDAVHEASGTELEALIRAVDDAAEDELERWLTGPEAQSPSPSREYVAITCLVMAADLARVRLNTP